MGSLASSSAGSPQHVRVWAYESVYDYSVAQCITDSWRLSLICTKWTSPNQASTSLLEFWTGLIPAQTLVKCILVTGRLQECLRGCGV